MKTLPAQSILRCCALAAVATCLPLRAEHHESLALPAWQILEYEQQAFFVTAHSRVQLTSSGDNDQPWRLIANSSVASNSEEVTLDMAADGRALYRARLSKGKDERYKTYDFGPEHILRLRHDPAPNTTLPPAEWPISSRKEIAYPPGAAGQVVTDSYALLLLAGRFLESSATSAELVVNTEFNFYRVRMSHANGPAIEVDFQVAGGTAANSGKQPTRAVTLAVSDLGKQPEKPDFSLLGLSGEITVLFDQEGKLPLQLRGTAPKIGDTEINLKAATLRNPAE